MCLQQLLGGGGYLASAGTLKSKYLRPGMYKIPDTVLSYIRPKETGKYPNNNKVNFGKIILDIYFRLRSKLHIYYYYIVNLSITVNSIVIKVFSSYVLAK